MMTHFLLENIRPIPTGKIPMQVGSLWYKYNRNWEGTVFTGACLFTPGREVPILDGDTYLGCGVPTLDGGLPTLDQGGGIYPGWGYLPWIGSTYLGQGRGLPPLDGGYIPWNGYLPWIRSTYPGWGVPTLDGGIYLGWDTYLGQGWDVPTLDGDTYLGWGGTYLVSGQEYLAWMGKGTYLG